MAKRVLAIDGGGIRGIIAAYWLWQLEKIIQTRFNKKLHDVFDVFAGTSTGAIIAAGLACQDFDAEHIYNLYKTDGSEIFKRRGVLSARCLWRGPKYTGQGLSNVLTREFKERTLKEARVRHKRILLVAFDAFSYQPVVFDSDDTEHENVRLRDLCQASASAPTYFPPTTIIHQGQSKPFLDGGIAANNPSAIALARMFKTDGWQGVLLCSIGTGNEHETINVAKVNAALRKRSKLRWAEPAISMLFAGSSAINDQIVGAMLPDNYFRLQTDVAVEKCGLDNVKSSNIDDICKIANDYWNLADTQLKVARLLDALDDAKTQSLTGRWRSQFTWGDRVGDVTPQGISFVEGTAEHVIIQQSGKFFSGHTDRDVPCEYPSAFRGRLVGEHDLIGEWQGKLAGAFQLRRNSETYRRCYGFWTGTGEGGQQIGTWTLERV